MMIKVTVECQKFYSAEEFETRKKELGVDEANFAEAEECVFFCDAIRNGVKGVACFF